jgi:hypothetical protein
MKEQYFTRLVRKRRAPENIWTQEGIRKLKTFKREKSYVALGSCIRRKKLELSL